jgi:hypothetical protein
LPPGFPEVPQYFNSIPVGQVLNQPDFSDFAWRTKNSVWNELNIQKGEVCQEQEQEDHSLLPIQIKHALPKWPRVDFRKKLSRQE